MSVPPTPAPAPSTPVPSTLVVPAVVRQDASLSCVQAPGGMSAVKRVKGNEDGDSVDFWEFDHERSAWKMNHVRLRQRLYTPVGKNCPFQPDSVTSERWTASESSPKNQLKVLGRIHKVFPKRIHQGGISQCFRMSSKLEIGPR